MLDQFVKDYVLWKEIHAGAGEESEDEGAAETKNYELTSIPIPHPPALSCSGEGVRRSSIVGICCPAKVNPPHILTKTRVSKKL